MSNVIRALIIDDEPLARKGIRRLLKSENDIEIVGECTDGLQAVECIYKQKPDLVFLDIQMPGLDGFGVVDAIGLAAMPVMIFITAYDLHAMRAFDVHAIDYLLKPVKPDRLTVALDRARAMAKRPRPAEFSERLTALLRTMKPQHDMLERIVIKSIGKISIVAVDDIDWIEAERDYVKLYTPEKNYLLRERISALEEKLDPAKFIRIHRSTIVRIERIRELRPLVNGDHIVILRNGRQLSLSRKFREQVFSRLQGAR